uniref:Uncharacterized protein n=1 Tax=Spongospora subterranea TaxID=70186 RepID=A0A0H5RTM0_9EUKA|eukprot:CRZ12089.1 hypothetical protein [Spongospora subterranea]
MANPDLPKIDRLGNLLEAHSSVFRMNVGFTLGDFEELCTIACPIFNLCSRSTGEMPQAGGRPPKLSSPERILAAIFYLNHNTTGRCESIHWNYSRFGIFDDALFVLSVITEVLDQWPDSERRRDLGSRISSMPGCIGFVNRTLCRIRRPQKPDHGLHHNRRKTTTFLQ